MRIERQLETLKLIEETTTDLHLSTAAHRKRAELLIEKALEGPRAEDAAEEARLAALEHDRLVTEQARERNLRVEIITEEPRRS